MGVTESQPGPTCPAETSAWSIWPLSVLYVINTLDRCALLAPQGSVCYITFVPVETFDDPQMQKLALNNKNVGLCNETPL